MSATSERGFRIKGDLNTQSWEEGDFPIACETCLGDNPYVRMTRERACKACKICERPFSNFRWKAGSQGRHKTTQVCQSCAKMKNVCQVCIFDLEYGLPVQLRDQYLEEQEKINVPKSDAMRQWAADNAERQATTGEGLPYGKQAPNEALLRLARRAPYYKRNLPHKCSFYAKGECKRGDECPYLHEMPGDRDDPLANQNVRDRFYGQNDPVAAKYMSRINAQQQLTAPEDTSVTSLYVGNMEPQITQDDLKDAFYSFGELANIRIVPRQRCAFVEYTTREAAQAAAEKLVNNLTIKGVRLRVTWATRPSNGPNGPGSATALPGGTSVPAYGTAGSAAACLARPDATGMYALPAPPGMRAPLALAPAAAATTPAAAAAGAGGGSSSGGSGAGAGAGAGAAPPAPPAPAPAAAGVGGSAGAPAMPQYGSYAQRMMPPPGMYAGAGGGAGPVRGGRGGGGGRRRPPPTPLPAARGWPGGQGWGWGGGVGRASTPPWTRNVWVHVCRRRK